MKKNLEPLLKIAILCIYLIILAGAIVRMTGSGMGCPDWPKCFGYWIPPTEISQVHWHANTNYKKGQMILRDQKLQIATMDFKSKVQFDLSNWKTYTKHSYANFNAWHTWIEYINRLVTVLSGIPILLVFATSFWFFRSNKAIPFFASLLLLSMGFQAWLGKVVVDSNLMPFRITVHMLMAFVILAILLLLLAICKASKERIQYPKSLKLVSAMVLAILLIQVILGTQVRQFVDDFIQSHGAQNLAKSLLHAPSYFYIHRSMSMVILLAYAWIFYQNKKRNYQIPMLRYIPIILIATIAIGMLIYYFDFPILSQPLHLVLASLLFGCQFVVVLKVFGWDQSKI